MDQEAEAMKTKKILWPWAERQIKGKKKTCLLYTSDAADD